MHTSKQINTVPSYFNGQDTNSGIPVEVQFRHMRESRQVLSVVDQMMEKFDKYEIPGAHATVLVDETHHRESKGVFQIKVRLVVPGERLYVARSQEKTGMIDGVFGAITDCFEGVERQLVKRHDRRSSHRLQRAFEDAAA